MTTYRTGCHHGVTIVREGDGYRCDLDGHDCDRGHLAAVVTRGFDGRTSEQEAAWMCARLNRAEDRDPDTDAMIAIQDWGAGERNEPPRCASCDHTTDMHDEAGRCWYTVTTGQPGKDLVCPCASTVVPEAAR